MSSEDDINTGYCKQDTCDVPSTSHVSATCSPYVSLSPSASPALSRYADYPRAMYANRPVAKADKWPPTPSTVYIKLALVKKERVSRAEARSSLTSHLTQPILQAKEQIEMDDIRNGGNKTRFVVAPGNGKSTFVWELRRQWLTLESLKRFSLVVLLRLQEVGVQTATHITDLLYHSNSTQARGGGGGEQRWGGCAVCLGQL